MKVFVTTELYPFTAGGIGRVISNILNSKQNKNDNDFLVVMVGRKIDAGQFSAIYPNVQLAQCLDKNYSLLSTERDALFPPQWAFSNTSFHHTSVALLQTLLSAEEEYGKFDYIEFPDWGGLGFATIQHKLLGTGFQETTLAVRLHSTERSIAAYETRPILNNTLCLFDIERKAIADADIVIGQLKPVADSTRNVFGISSEIWDEKLVIHAPPVLLDSAACVETIRVNENTPIVFSSKIQKIKRPDIFIRGCVGFIRNNPEYKGEIHLLANSSDHEYTSSIEKLIPSDLANRFVFYKTTAAGLRDKIISQSICVFPGGWESFCLAAYEASLLGAQCILNEKNPAFGENTPWEDGVNCVKFDESVIGLTEALSRLFRERDAVTQIVKVPEDTQPWDMKHKPASKVEKGRDDTLQDKVSIIIPHYNLGQYLASTIDSVLASTYPNLEIVVVDDASTDAWSKHIIDQYSRNESDLIKIIRCDYNIGLSAVRNLALKHCTGEYILPLDADDIIHPNFIELAVQALKRSPDFDYVVPQTAFFADHEEINLEHKEKYTDYAIFHGDAYYSGLFENRFSTATMLIRAETLKRFGYREELKSYEDWDLYQRMIAAGIRSIVTNNIYFYYRRRPSSMIHSPEAIKNQVQNRRALLSGKSFKDYGDIPLMALNYETNKHKAAGDIQSLSASDAARLHDFESSEVVFAALRMAKFLERKAPWLLPLGRNTARTLWRSYKAIARRGR